MKTLSKTQKEIVSKVFDHVETEVKNRTKVYGVNIPHTCIVVTLKNGILTNNLVEVDEDDVVKSALKVLMFISYLKGEQHQVMGVIEYQVVFDKDEEYVLTFLGTSIPCEDSEDIDFIKIFKVENLESVITDKGVLKSNCSLSEIHLF